MIEYNDNYTNSDKIIIFFLLLLLKWSILFNYYHYC